MLAVGTDETSFCNMYIFGRKHRLGIAETKRFKIAKFLPKFFCDRCQWNFSIDCKNPDQEFITNFFFCQLLKPLLKCTQIFRFYRKPGSHRMSSNIDQ